MSLCELRQQRGVKRQCRASVGHFDSRVSSLSELGVSLKHVGHLQRTEGKHALLPAVGQKAAAAQLGEGTQRRGCGHEACNGGVLRL